MCRLVENIDAGDQAPALTDIRGTLAYSWRTVQIAGRDLGKRAVPIGIVALFLAARLMALQAASLLVIPLYWTLPRILDLQATLPAAIMEGASYSHRTVHSIVSVVSIWLGNRKLQYLSDNFCS